MSKKKRSYNLNNVKGTEEIQSLLFDEVMKPRKTMVAVWVLWTIVLKEKCADTDQDDQDINNEEE